MSKTINYEGSKYRIIEVSPSQKYLLAQKSDYPAVGNAGAFMDAPIDLFRVEKDHIEYIDHAFCPYDTLYNPYLREVIWFEEEGFVKLRFTAMELMETQGERIYFFKTKVNAKRIKARSEKPTMMKELDPDKEYIENKNRIKKILLSVCNSSTSKDVEEAH